VRNVVRPGRAMCVLGMLCVLAAPASAQESATPRVDALGSEPAPKGSWRVGAFVGAAHNSPVNAIIGPGLGTIKGRNHTFVGFQAQTTVAKIKASRLSWGIQVLPALIVTGASDASAFYWRPDPVESRDRRVGYAFGVSPFSLEWAVPVAGRVSAYVNAAGGLVIFTRPFPFDDSQRANFTLEYGGGLMVRMGTRQWLQLGYKFHHLSNAHYAIANPGLDAHVFYLGYWRSVR
jgi:hypothetical protein